jgi:DNA invertase Pin-like site-specific DNA recombinase
MGTGPVRVALVARVSTTDKGQDTEVQLSALREYAARAGWTVVGEYADQASAGDYAHRKAWKRLQADVRAREIDLVAVVKLDRAFRSTLDCLNTLREWEHHNVGFVATTQPIDTTSPTGRLLLTILAAVAEMERSLIGDRTREGLRFARSKGAVLGRPRVVLTGVAEKRWPEVRDEVRAGQLSKTRAAKRLRVSFGTLLRLLAEDGEPQKVSEGTLPITVAE